MELVELKIIHIMKDGTVRNSVEGIKIPNRDFYKIVNGIQEKQKRKVNDGQG